MERTEPRRRRNFSFHLPRYQAALWTREECRNSATNAACGRAGRFPRSKLDGDPATFDELDFLFVVLVLNKHSYSVFRAEQLGMTQSTINIVGAGIGGVTLGRCLLKRGISSVLYERMSSSRRHGYGITLHSSAYQPLLKVWIWTSGVSESE